MDSATLEIVVVLALVVVVFFGFIREWLPPDVVALGAVSVLLATRILDIQDVLGVFSNSAPATIAAMFVLSAALERTGVIGNMERFVSIGVTQRPAVALLMMMICVMIMSAFINNTPVVVILTPVAIKLAQGLDLPPSKLLIPLSFASIFGGTCTLIGTSTNILVDGVASKHGLAPFGMFEITLVGLVLGSVGVIYLLLVGRWLLPERQSLTSLLPNLKDRHFLAEALIPLDSPLVGKPLQGAGFTEERGLRVIDVIRHDVSHRYRLDEIELQAGDRVVLRSKVGDMLGLREAGDVAFGGRDIHAIEPIATRETVVMEGVVGPDSRFLNRRIAALNLRRTYGAYILAIYRQGEGLARDFDEVRLRMGDTLLLEGPLESMRRLFDYQELINLVEPGERPLRRGKAWLALLSVLAMMLLASLEILPIAALAIMAAVAVVAFRCVEADEAYSSIHWNIIMLIFGMLALGVAMEKTGAARLIVEQAARLVDALGPVAVLSLVYILTSCLTEVMSNNAAAILLTPIAIGLAEQLGVDPRPFVVAVMFAASASFATPIGYQTNTFVFGAGGYRFTDFLKIGLPLNLLLWAVATLIIPLYWPL